MSEQAQNPFEDARPEDLEDLAGVILRAQHRRSVPALLAVCHALAARLLRGVDSPLTDEERHLLGWLCRVHECRPLPTAPVVPLSKMQARLLALVERAGIAGINEQDVRQELWPHASDRSGRLNLRVLILKTNRKLRGHDFFRRRIERRPNHFLFCKMLSNR